jgi:SAM-dependent methyltransferase
MIRRLYEPAFHQRYLVGRGIDVGSGDDSLATYAFMFPRITSVDSWDKAHGDAEVMEGVAPETYDFVASSHCLEHLGNPTIALENWLRITKVGGHVIIVVPDEGLYEQHHWPSRFNTDHKWRFSVDGLCGLLPTLSGCRVLKLALLEATHETEGRGDQTQGIGECAIEFVLRKVGPPASA